MKTINGITETNALVLSTRAGRNYIARFIGHYQFRAIVLFLCSCSQLLRALRHSPAARLQPLPLAEPVLELLHRDVVPDTSLRLQLGLGYASLQSLYSFAFSFRHFLVVNIQAVKRILVKFLCTRLPK